MGAAAYARSDVDFVSFAPQRPCSPARERGAALCDRELAGTRLGPAGPRSGEALCGDDSRRARRRAAAARGRIASHDEHRADAARHSGTLTARRAPALPLVRPARRDGSATGPGRVGSAELHGDAGGVK